MYFFYFVDIFDKFKFILVFVIGLDLVFFLGFFLLLKLKFCYLEVDENFSVFVIFYVNICFNILSIFVIEIYNVFKEVMDNVLDLGCLFIDY